MTPRRVAMVLIAGGYGLLGAIVAAVRLIASSSRLDVGGVMASTILLGSAGVLAGVALLIGSLLGSYVIITTPPARRIGFALAVVGGWIGAVFLGWILWGFWTG